jgi:hypothetical protein
MYFSDGMLKALNESVFMYQTGTVESLLNLKYWSIGLVIVPLVLLTVVVVVLVRPTVPRESCTNTLACYCCVSISIAWRHVRRNRAGIDRRREQAASTPPLSRHPGTCS